MEYAFEPQNYSRDPKCSRTDEKIVAPHTRHSLKLGDILVTNNPPLSDSDLHCDFTRTTTSALPQNFQKQQRQGAESYGVGDEMVKYMSRVPSYLEKGKPFQGTALNFGVLDWRRLEKWKYSNNPMPCRNNGFPPTSRTSHLSHEEPSSSCSRVQSPSAARPSLNHSSMQSHLEASPNSVRDTRYGGRTHRVSPSHQKTYHVIPRSHHSKACPSEGQSPNDHFLPGYARKFEKVSSSAACSKVRQQKLYEIDMNHEQHSDNRLENHEGRNYNSGFSSEADSIQSLGSCDVASPPWKGKMTMQRSELTKGGFQSQNHHLCDAVLEPDCSKRCNRVIILMPKDSKSQSLYQSLPNNQLDVRPGRGRTNCSAKHELKEVCGSGLLADDAYSCPWPSEGDNKRTSEVRESCSQGGHGFKPFPPSMKSRSSPSRGLKVEEKESTVVRKSVGQVKSSVESEKRTGSESSAKTRHPSPIHRFGSAVGSIISRAGSRDNSPMRRSLSRETMVKSGLDGAVTSVSSNDFFSDKSHANNNRSRSSPLRRLLGPLLKPKASVDSLKGDSASMSLHQRSSNEQLYLSKEQATKMKLGFFDRRALGGSFHKSKEESLKLQAFLQIAVKNGLPLFTFAVDNCGDILAAMLRKSTAPGKNQFGWVYTFFTVKEVKKKNGLWLNQGSKGKNNNEGYIPNVVAQMKVLNAQSPPNPGHKLIKDNAVKEFSLFSVDVSQVDQHATEFQPTNELAAIIVKLLNQSQMGPRDRVPMSRHSECGYGLADGSSQENQGLSTTVILPGGVHTVPSKGSISTLTQRWRSGGSCDCGGWDVGCQLMILSNQGKLGETSGSSKATNGVDEFKLFNQVGQDKQLLLSLSSFKDRIYSVEFDSSISPLQAFATSVSVLDCGRSSTVGVPDNLMQKNMFRREAAPASYTSYPPDSPVGRA